jgi:hypothetical protein
MNVRVILAKAFEAVTFLFAGFGFFLKKIAPPDRVSETGSGPAPFAVGLASVLAMLVLLYVSALAAQRRTQYRRRWLIASGISLTIAPLLGLGYFLAQSRLTVAFPPDAPDHLWVAGTYLQSKPAELRAGGMSNGALLDYYGGPKYIDKVWPAQAQDQAQIILVTLYVAFVLSVACTVFCITEALLNADAAAEPDTTSHAAVVDGAAGTGGPVADGGIRDELGVPAESTGRSA